MTTIILGVGDAGTAISQTIVKEKLRKIHLAVINTHPQNLKLSPVLKTLWIGEHGTGGNPAIGKQIAEEHISEIITLLQPAARLFLVCGLGGGTGSGAVPIIARSAAEMGIDTHCIASMPFQFEGPLRGHIAAQARQEISQHIQTGVFVDSNTLMPWLDTTPAIQEVYGLLNRLMAWNTLVALAQNSAD